MTVKRKKPTQLGLKWVLLRKGELVTRPVSVGCVWKPGRWKAISKEAWTWVRSRRGCRGRELPPLCTMAWLHYYQSDTQRIEREREHTAYPRLRGRQLWLVEVRGKIRHQEDKSGATEMRLLRRVPLSRATKGLSREEQQEGRGFYSAAGLVPPKSLAEILAARPGRKKPLLEDLEKLRRELK